MSKIPGFQDMMLPVLEIIRDGKKYRYAEVEGEMCAHMQIDEEVAKERTSSGYGAVRHRITWVKHYLKRHGLVEEAPGKLQISPKGKEALEKHRPVRVDLRWLKRHYPVPLEDDDEGEEEGGGDQSPHELIEQGAKLLKQKLKGDLRDKLKSSDVEAHHFEKIVADVFRKLNYGVIDEVGGTSDGGVDIEIKRDGFGLDVIYCQVKKYSDAKITPEQVRGFAGALDTKRAKCGVFVTLSDFTEEARKAADSMTDKTIKLINGPDLIELMIEHGVGTNVEESVQIKKVDGDYFNRLSEP